MIAPTTNRVTQGLHGKYKAVDYSAKPNKTFYAPEDGKITAYGASGLCGNRLELTAGANRHGFCHLERPLVSVGQWVKKGQAIGIMGYTGYTIPSGAAGRHLHWVISRNGVYVYPPSLVNETPNQGSKIMDTDAKVKAQYYTLRGNEGTANERKGWIGQSYEKFNSVARSEVDGREAQRRNLESAVKTLTTQRDQARTEVATLKKELLGCQDQIKILTGQVKEKDAEIAGMIESQKQLEKQYQEQIKTYEEAIKTKDTEIERLSKELAACSNNGKLTAWQLIVMGIKKLFSKGA